MVANEGLLLKQKPVCPSVYFFNAGFKKGAIKGITNSEFGYNRFFMVGNSWFDEVKLGANPTCIQI